MKCDQCQWVCLSSIAEKRGLSRLTATHSWESRQRRRGPVQRQAVVRQTRPMGEEREKAICSTLLRRITRLKLKKRNFRDCVEGSAVLPRQVFPEGLTASGRTGVSNTLAQNCHCEFCCGTHLTCKNPPITPNRHGWVKRPEKSYQEATIAIARVVSRQNWRLKLIRLRKPYRKSGDIQLVEKRQGGSFPKKDLLCRYVRMISPDITISNHFLRGAADGMRFTAPLPRKKLKVLHLFRCFTHTHTLTHLKDRM